MPVEVANTLSSIGIFFAGLGILLLSFGLLMYTKNLKSNTSGIS
jgi:hypothetical protein